MNEFEKKHPRASLGRFTHKPHAEAEAAIDSVVTIRQETHTQEEFRQEIFDTLLRIQAFDDLTWAKHRSTFSEVNDSIVLIGPNNASVGVKLRTDGPVDAALRNIATAYSEYDAGDEEFTADYDNGEANRDDWVDLKADQEYFHDRAEAIFADVGRWDTVQGFDRMYAPEFQYMTGTPPVLEGATVRFEDGSIGSIRVPNTGDPEILKVDGSIAYTPDELPTGQFVYGFDQIYQISTTGQSTEEEFNAAMDAKTQRQNEIHNRNVERVLKLI